MNFLSNRSYGRDILKVCLDHGTRKENGVSPVRILTDDHPILRSEDLNPLSYKKLLRSCVASVMHTIRINNVKNIFLALSNFNTVRFFCRNRRSRNFWELHQRSFPRSSYSRGNKLGRYQKLLLYLPIPYLC